MDLAGKKVTVVGLGRTALGAVRLLLREGAEPFVTDSAAPDRLAAFSTELDALGVAYESGGHSDGAFREVDLIVLSPGVSPGIPPVAKARANGCEVVGEMELAFPYCRSRVLAVTGTNGKTTTTELLKTLAASCEHEVLLAGNNELPFSDAVQVAPAPEFIVLEVSSYQLETARAFRPWIGVVLNVAPDHLARHRSVEEYAAVKARMFAHQSQEDHAVVNADDPRVRAMAQDVLATVWSFSLDRAVERGLWLDGDAIRSGRETIATVSDVQLPGRHNLQNVLAALTAAEAGRFDREKVREGLRSFRGVEHRIEYVASANGVRFYNDSKSTNVDSLRVALESFDAPIVLIAGGEGKGADYAVLEPLVRQHVKHLVTIGQDAPAIEQAFGEVTDAQRAAGMREAVALAGAAASPGDVVLLSPACASFDMFDNFEHRGRVFKEAVREYIAGKPAAARNG